MRWRETGSAPLCRLRVIGLLDESEVLLHLPFAPCPLIAWVAQRLGEHHQVFLRARARTAECWELARASASRSPNRARARPN